MKIESGVGNGKWAAIDKNNRIQTASETFPYQHIISKEEEQAYQVFGTTTVANGSVVALHGKNTSTTRNMVFTYFRHQVLDAAGGTAFPTTASYISMNANRTYSSGGSVATPVNMSIGSGNLAEATFYVGAPTVTGTATEFDRWYTKSEGDMNTFNKEGAFIVQPGQTFDMSYTSDHTSGTIFVRASFLMEDIEIL